MTSNTDPVRGLDYTPGRLDETAPERIWLQIDTAGNNADRDLPFPDADGVTWEQDSVGGLEIQYVRADLASAPPSAPDRMAIRMLVAAGFVTDAKANEALQIAHGFISGPLEPPSAPRGVGEVRPDYRPAFDLPTTAAEALAWLTQQGDPTCMTFSPAKAKRAAELLGAALQQTETDPVTAAAIAELNRAVQKFPTWPTDPLHAVAVLGEEFGELTKAVLQSVYEPHKVTPGDVQTEAVQVAAMALRFLRSLHSYEFTPGAQHEQPALSQQPAAVEVDDDGH